MSQFGEGAQTGTIQDDAEEFHWLEVHYCYPDGLPVEGTYLATDSDGLQHRGSLNDLGGLCLNYLPAGQVDVEFIPPEDSDTLDTLHKTIKDVLNEILAERQAEAETEPTEARLERMGAFEQGGSQLASARRGFWNGAVGLIEFAKDTLVTVANIDEYLSPIERLNNLLEDSYKSYQSGDLTEGKWRQSLLDNMEQEELEDLTRLLGFDLNKIDLTLITEAYEITALIARDDATLAILKNFAKDYVGAQSSLDWAEFAGGGVFDIVLAALLIAFTRGARLVAQEAGSKISHISRLRKLGGLLRHLGKVLKRKQLNKKIKVGVDKKTKVEADRLEGPKLAARAPKRSCECFNKPKSGKVSEKDMLKQIKEQQNKINSMDPAELKRRRDKVKALQAQKKGLGSLRDGASQSEKRAIFRQDKFDKLELKYGRKSAKNKIIKLMAGLDATHALDIVAGGDPSDISGVQNRSVNRSMGPQWMQKGRLDVLDKAIADALGPPKRNMNFEMELCGVRKSNNGAK